MKSVRRGVSPVIATVLLLVITVVLVGIIAGFVVPFVNKLLTGSGECYDVLKDLEFKDTGYSCYVSAPAPGYTGFSVRVNDAAIAGFRVVLYSEGTAEPREVIGGIPSDTVRTLNGDFNTPLTLPPVGGVSTYVTQGAFNKIELFPLLTTGRTCDVSDTMEVSPCNNATVITKLTSPPTP